MATKFKVPEDKMTAFNEPHFEKKLLALKDSQESIQALSTWCLGHRQHHKLIVTNWLKVLKKVKLDHRLALFYLANDVIQYSKRKSYEFVESWGTALQRATTMVRDEKVKNKILRIFKIWGERGIYDETFVADLCGLMTSQAKKKPEPEAENLVDMLDFQPATLFVKIRSCHKLEDDTDLRLKRLNESHVSFSDADALRRHLKQKRQGDDVVAEVEEGVAKMQAYMKALEKEIKERKMLIEELDIADRFYEAQRGDAKLVVNAYKNFSGRVRNLKRHLDERLPTFSCPSPVPSPDYNAPSPEPDCDIELPDDNAAADFAAFLPGGPQSAQSNAMDNCFASFLGNGGLPFEFQKNLFSESTDENNESEGKPIEVINNRTESELNTNITNFLKSLSSGGLPKSPLTLDHSTPPPAPFPPYEVAAAEPPGNEYDYPLDPSPMEPPPMMPDLFNSDKFPAWEAEAEAWIEENGAWLDEKPLETPESPPMSEKKSFAEPIVYDQSASLQVLGSSADVDQRRLPMALDHRQIPPPAPGKDMDHRTHLSRSKDVDHRNLISLTGSPIQEVLPPPPGPPKLWPLDEDFRHPPVRMNSVSDIDYRLPPPPPPLLKEVPIENCDNVESVDMDLSDDDCTEVSPVKVAVPNAKPPDKPLPPALPVSKMTAISPLSGVNNDQSPTSSYKRQFHGSKKIETISVTSPRPLLNRVPFSPIRAGAPPSFGPSSRGGLLPTPHTATTRPPFQQPPPHMMPHNMPQMQPSMNEPPPSHATPPPSHGGPPPGQNTQGGHNGPLMHSGPPPGPSGPPPNHSVPPPGHVGSPLSHNAPSGHNVPPGRSAPPPGLACPPLDHSGSLPGHGGPSHGHSGSLPNRNAPGGHNGPLGRGGLPLGQGGPPLGHSGPPPDHSGPPPGHGGPPMGHNALGGHNVPPGHSGPPTGHGSPSPGLNSHGGHNGPLGRNLPPGGQGMPLADRVSPSMRLSLGNNSPMSGNLRPPLGQNRPPLGPPGNKPPPPSLLSLPFKQASFPENRKVDMELTEDFTDDVMITNEFQDEMGQEFCSNNTVTQVQNTRNGLENLQRDNIEMNDLLECDEDLHMNGRVNEHMQGMPPQRGRMGPPQHMGLLRPPLFNEPSIRREFLHHPNEPPKWEDRNSERSFEYDEDSLVEMDEFSERNNSGRGQFTGPRPLLSRDFLPPRMRGSMLNAPRRGMGPRMHLQGRGGARGHFRPQFRGRPQNPYGGW